MTKTKPAFAFLIALLLLATIAMAETETKAEDEIPQTQSHVVTSVEGCLSQLSPAAAAHVRQSLKPYEDCQNRLKDKLATEQKDEEAKKNAKPPVAENARNYMRVQAEPAAAAPVGTDKSEKSKP